MKFKTMITAFLVTTLMSTNAFATSITLNGANLQTDTSPVVVNGRTLVPVRSIFESLGATVSWDDSTKTVTALRDTTNIKLALNQPTATVNGNSYTLDVPAQIVNGRTMVPVRFVAENLNCTVNWDAATQTIAISTVGTTQQAANKYKVLRVVDGDTFVINYLGNEEKVRLIGVDTPESVHPDATKNSEAGKTASEYTKQLIEGKEVELEFDVQERDKYGRLLAYVYVDGYMLNKKLLEDGYAVIATYPPNVKYVDDFKAISGITEKETNATTANTTTTQATSQTKNATTNTTDNKSKTVYITRTGKKYHYDGNCNGGTYFASTLTEALAKGLTACSKCAK